MDGHFGNRFLNKYIFSAIAMWNYVPRLDVIFLSNSLTQLFCS